jgi:hypothetical protein
VLRETSIRQGNLVLSVSFVLIEHGFIIQKHMHQVFVHQKSIFSLDCILYAISFSPPSYLTNLLFLMFLQNIVKNMENRRMLA